MLQQDEIYLQGYGAFLGIPYFCGKQSHLGYIKLISFITLFASSPLLLDRVPCLAFLTILGDQIWNVIIMTDIMVFLCQPTTFKGIVWTPSDQAVHLVQKESQLKPEKICVMLVGYVVFAYICIPYLYGMWSRFVYRALQRSQHHELVI